MVNLEDVFLKIGFLEIESFIGGRVFSFQTSKMTITTTYLAVVPELGFGPGYAMHNTYKNGRIIQPEATYIPATTESFEHGLAYIAYGIGLNEERKLGEIPEWYVLGKKNKYLLS